MGSIGATAAKPQAAVVLDPPQDKVHPANAIPFSLPTHRVRINALLFSAAGSGAHSTVILLHGVSSKAIANRAVDGALSTQDTNELITAISDTQGKLAHTERLISFAQSALVDHSYDN